MHDYLNYSLKPILISAETAHKEGLIVYDEHGAVTFTHPDLEEYTGKKSVHIPSSRQFPSIFATYWDLGKSLSSRANSPLFENGKTLRQEYEDTFQTYLEQLKDAQSKNKWEADHGTYVYDHFEEKLYLIAPEKWYRIGILVSNAKLLTDPDEKLSWYDIQETFGKAVVGIAGASVGGNIAEGIARIMRPQMKIADSDWQEITGYNRAERSTLRYLVASRAKRKNPKDPMELENLRFNKAELLAHELHLVYPYAKLWVYKDGLTDTNIGQFLSGNGTDEPPLTMLFEEMDNPKRKFDDRKRCKQLGIPVFMISDFGLRSQVQIQDFNSDPNTPLGIRCSDEELEAMKIKALQTGNREDTMAFIRGLCGKDFAVDQFKHWVDDTGEQPVSSIPQNGAIAQISGGIGGIEAALFTLKHIPKKHVVFDFFRKKISEG